MSSTSPSLVMAKLIHACLYATETSPGPVADAIEKIARRGAQSSLAGTALFVSVDGGIRLALGCTDCKDDTVAIPMPDDRIVGDLLAALFCAPFPVVILAILHAAGADGRDLEEADRQVINMCVTRFRDLLVNSSGIELMTEALASEENRVPENGGKPTLPNNANPVRKPSNWPTPEADALVTAARHKLNALAPCQVKALDICKQGVRIVRRTAKPAPNTIRIDLAAGGRFVTAANIAAAIGQRDVRDAIGGLIDVAAGRVSYDARDLSSRVASVVFGQANRYPLNRPDLRRPSEGGPS